MAITPKAWNNGTTVDAAAMIDLETRMGSYADSVGSTSLYTNVRSYGAVGNGVTDDTTAINAAFAVGSGVFFPSGDYVYTGSGYSGVSPVVIGAGRAKSSILLGAGCSLLTPSTAIGSLVLTGMTISGGFGAIRSTYTGINVASLHEVYGNDFLNYTGAAISTLASDMPNWHIRHNRFFAANDTSTMGVVLSSATDNCDISDNVFDRNRVHVKFLGGGDLHLDRNGFLRWNASASNPRVDVWFVPSGGIPNETMFCSGNKFGNENLLAGDFKVLYAEENTSSGTGHASYFPDTTNASANIIARHRFTANMTNGNSPGSVIPFVYSMTPNVYSCEYSGAMGGTPPAYILKYQTPPSTADRFGGRNLIGPWTDIDVGVNLPTVQPSNDTSGYILDPEQILVYDRPLHYHGGSDRAGYKNLLSDPVSAFSLIGTATRAAITDALGGTDAATVTLPNSGGAQLTDNIATPTIGAQVWIEFDLKQSASTPVVSIEIRMQYTSNGAIHYRRILTPLAAWRRYRLLWTPREASTTILFAVLQSPGAATGNIDVGRVRVYHAYEPQIEPSTYRQSLRTVTYSASMTPDVTNSRYQKITITDGTAMTINAPTGAAIGQSLTLDILNSSGGAHGAINTNSIFKIVGGGTVLVPATTITTTHRRTFSFYYDGTNWVEINRVTADTF